MLLTPSLGSVSCWKKHVRVGCCSCSLKCTIVIYFGWKDVTLKLFTLYYWSIFVINTNFITSSYFQQKIEMPFPTFSTSVAWGILLSLPSLFMWLTSFGFLTWYIFYTKLHLLFCSTVLFNSFLLQKHGEFLVVCLICR